MTPSVLVSVVVVVIVIEPVGWSPGDSNYEASAEVLYELLGDRKEEDYQVLT